MWIYFWYLNFLFLSSIGLLGCSQSSEPPVMPATSVRILHKEKTDTFSIKTIQNEISASDYVRFESSSPAPFLKVTTQCARGADLSTHSTSVHSLQLQFAAVLPAEVFTPTSTPWICSFDFELVHSNGSSSRVLLKNKTLTLDTFETEPLLFQGPQAPATAAAFQEADFSKNWILNLKDNESVSLICENFESTKVRNSENLISLQDLASPQEVRSFVKRVIDPRHYQPSQKCRIRVIQTNQILISSIFNLNFRALKPNLQCHLHLQHFSTKTSQILPYLKIEIQNPFSFPLTLGFLKQSTQIVRRSLSRGGGEHDGTGETVDFEPFPIYGQAPESHFKVFENKMLVWIPAKTTVQVEYQVHLITPSGKQSGFQVQSVDELCKPFLLQKNFQSVEEMTDVGFYQDPNSTFERE